MILLRDLSYTIRLVYKKLSKSKIALLRLRLTS